MMILLLYYISICMFLIVLLAWHDDFVIVLY